MRTRSPGIKLLFTILIAGFLAVPLAMVYALVYDRQDQAQTAQQSIYSGWGGEQVIAGPVLVVPYTTTEMVTVEQDGKTLTRSDTVERSLYISPQSNAVESDIKPQERRISIYRSVLFEATVKGKASFVLPADLTRFGIERDSLIWSRAEVRVGVSDARGLTRGGTITANGQNLEIQPGKGPAATNSEGFFAFVPWNGDGALAVDYSYGLRGSRILTLVPRGGSTSWSVTSSWANPSFAGSFLPETRKVSDQGFSANYTIDKLALGQPPVSSSDYTFPQDLPNNDTLRSMSGYSYNTSDAYAGENTGVSSRSVSVGLVEPVNLYSKVDRAVKYGFLFIGFTFLAYLLFDIVGGARVAVAEYLLTGAGLILFFVLLLAFAEVIGFTASYILASAAIIGLLTAYSAAVLGSWKRARFMGALLVGLYALLFVLLNLDAWSLLIGSVLLFVALAGVMYATRKIDWSSVGRRPDDDEAETAGEVTPA
ncbi:MAG: cell envelope integrity protein CreD [Sphingomonadaceae bacterium]